MLEQAELVEKQSYNSLAISLMGDYRKLDVLMKQYGSWASAYQYTNTGGDDRHEKWNELIKHSIRLILPTDDEFPSLLREIPWQPHALYATGAPLSDTMKIAVVGTRKATAAGLEIVKRFSQELATAGLIIVSGLALGVDTNAHEGALLAKGKTIAVLACGLDAIYPKQNEQLAKRIIAAKGTILSEYPPGTPAYPARFIERNRITSGLARGSLVVEAPKKSGSLATARFAIEQNREVFVVPGAITNPNYEGSHTLIRSGAQLVTNPTEILEHLEIKPKSPRALFQEGTFDKLEKKHRIILQTLHKSGMPLSADELAEATGLHVNEIAEALTLLTLEDIIKEAHGTYFIT